MMSSTVSNLTLTGHQEKGPDTTVNNKVRVHNADLYVEYMQSADWSENVQPENQYKLTNTMGSGSRRVATTGTKKPAKKFGGSFGSPPGTTKVRKAGAGNNSSSNFATTGGGLGGTTEKQREAFLEKQVVKEQQFRQKFEVARQHQDRRAKERADQKEKDFEARFLEFITQNHTLVDEVDGAVRADDAWRIRKRERLFNEWTLKVFQPMQEEINSKLASTNSDEIESKRRQMFQSFLDESNRKKNGLFRDIIIESDYDPVMQAKQSTMTYAKASILDDPTKNRSTREEGDRLVKGLMEARRSHQRDGARQSDKQPPRQMINVEMWDRMESTPYGRYSNETEVKVNDQFMKSNVGFDHYTYKTGRDAFEDERVIRGKSKGPSSNHAKESTVKECFTIPTKVERRPMTSAPLGGSVGGSFLPPLS